MVGWLHTCHGHHSNQNTYAHGLLLNGTLTSRKVRPTSRGDSPLEASGMRAMFLNSTLASVTGKVWPASSACWWRGRTWTEKR
jgi:hypothetical protein